MGSNLTALAIKYTPVIYRDARLDDERLIAWAADPRGTLYLTGPTGVGKTWAAWALVRAIMSDYPGNGPVYFEGGDIATLLHQARPGFLPDFQRGSLDTDRVARIRRAYLGLLDDLGGVKTTDWGADLLFDIIDTRVNSARPTIVTSNLTPGELTDVLGDRIASRLARGATVIQITGPDRRKAAAS